MREFISPGGGKISADRDSAAFTNEFCSAEARAFEAEALDKLALAPSVWFQKKLPTGASNGATQLRPLLDDFLKSEWTFEMRDTTNGSPEYVLAIRLNDTRARLWSDNLRGLIEPWTKISAQTIPGGWRLKKDLPPNLFQFTRQGDWVVLDCGENKLTGPQSPGVMAGRSAETNWLSVAVDWPRLAQIFPALREFDFPKISLQTFADGNGYLHFTGKLKLSQPLPAGAVEIPTNEIIQPFVSFTAARGMGPWLARQRWFQPFKLQPQPDQFEFGHYREFRF